MAENEAPLPPAYKMYVDLMEEARLRIEALNFAIMARETWNHRLLQEFCYLQLRILCEQIAIGCLIAHGEIKNNKALKAWRVPDIMKALENLDENYFPTGIVLTSDGKSADAVLNTNLQITKVELSKLWEKSGQLLHRGTALSVMQSHNKVLNVNLDIVILWAQKISNLLSQHTIPTADKRYILIAALSSGEHGGHAGIWIAASPS